MIEAIRLVINPIRLAKVMMRNLEPSPQVHHAPHASENIGEDAGNSNKRSNIEFVLDSRLLTELRLSRNVSKHPSAAEASSSSWETLETEEPMS